MSKMNICKNEENWTCGNNEVVVDNPLKKNKNATSEKDAAHCAQYVKVIIHAFSPNSKCRFATRSMIRNQNIAKCFVAYLWLISQY